MLKKTMTYEDYNGVPRTEDFYFNLTPAEVTEMELSVDGGLVEMINRGSRPRTESRSSTCSRTSSCGPMAKSPRRQAFRQESGDPGRLRPDQRVQRPVHGAGHRRQSHGRIRQRRHPAAEEGPAPAPQN
ncbi:MAG: hypothetical protein ACLRIS_07370 [Flavonifractor plautii]